MATLANHMDRGLVEGANVRAFRREKSRHGWGAVRGTWPPGGPPSEGYTWSGHPHLVWKSRFAYLRRVLDAEDVSTIKQKIAVQEWAGRNDYDGFVTECSAFNAYRKQRDVGVGATIMTPAEALCLVGLHRRLNGVYEYHLGRSATIDLGQLGHWYQITQALLPELAGLGSHEAALRHRLARALFARDRLLGCYFHPPRARAALEEDAFFFFDALLVSLVGAFDLWARLATERLALEVDGKPFPIRAVGWNKTWKKALRARSEDIADLFAEKPGSVIAACTAMRNWIHGPPLTAGSFQKGYEDPEGGLYLTDKQTRRDVEDMLARYRGEWGELFRHQDCLILKLPIFAERLMVVALGVLSSLSRHLVPGPVPSARSLGLLATGNRTSSTNPEQERIRQRHFGVCLKLVGLRPEPAV